MLFKHGCYMPAIIIIMIIGAKLQFNNISGLVITDKASYDWLNAVTIHLRGL